MKASGYRLWGSLPEKSPAALQAATRELWGMEITEADARKVIDLAPKRHEPYHALGEVLCAAYTYVGWTAPTDMPAATSRCTPSVRANPPAGSWTPRTSPASVRRPWGSSWRS